MVDAEHAASEADVHAWPEGLDELGEPNRAAFHDPPGHEPPESGARPHRGVQLRHGDAGRAFGRGGLRRLRTTERKDPDPAPTECLSEEVEAGVV